MNLATVEPNRRAVVVAIREDRHLSRFRALGILPGASIEVVGRTSSRGVLVKVDDTRLVLGQDLAEKISCTYSQTAE
ncbi:MAG: FeoA family protein [Candidatus Nanopelagicaceae bacterium]|nr:FeoA family protein [Candidatus Nanopelagicaceae bacterium]